MTPEERIMAAEERIRVLRFIIRAKGVEWVNLPGPAIDRHGCVHQHGELVKTPHLVEAELAEKERLHLKVQRLRLCIARGLPCEEQPS